MERTITTEIVINAPKEIVWKVLTDFAAYQQWNPFITSIVGDLQIGSRLVNTMINGGKKFVFKPIILNVTTYRYFDWLGSLLVKGIFDGRHYFEIEELGPSQVMVGHGERFSGMLSGYLLRKIGDDTRNNFIKMNNALKTRAEQMFKA